MVQFPLAAKSAGGGATTCSSWADSSTAIAPRRAGRVHSFRGARAATNASASVRPRRPADRRARSHVPQPIVVPGQKRAAHFLRAWYTQSLRLARRDMAPAPPHAAKETTSRGNGHSFRLATPPLQLARRNAGTRLRQRARVANGNPDIFQRDPLQVDPVGTMHNAADRLGQQLHCRCLARDAAKLC
jgi:hypothetical protein